MFARFYLNRFTIGIASQGHMVFHRKLLLFVAIPALVKIVRRLQRNTIISTTFLKLWIFNRLPSLKDLVLTALNLSLLLGIYKIKHHNMFNFETKSHLFFQLGYSFTT